MSKVIEKTHKDYFPDAEDFDEFGSLFQRPNHRNTTNAKEAWAVDLDVDSIQGVFLPFDEDEFEYFGAKCDEIIVIDVDKYLPIGKFIYLVDFIDLKKLKRGLVIIQKTKTKLEWSSQD